MSVEIIYIRLECSPIKYNRACNIVYETQTSQFVLYEIKNKVFFFIFLSFDSPLQKITEHYTVFSFYRHYLFARYNVHVER
jgi:hypothetical protein